MKVRGCRLHVATMQVKEKLMMMMMEPSRIMTSSLEEEPQTG